MVRFSLFGIPVRVELFFWITLALIGGGLGANSPDAFFAIGLFVIAGFISILVHELGHALTAKAFGAQVEIVLQAFGGYAAYSGVNLSRPKSFMVTAAGPAIQLLLGLLVFLIIQNVPDIAPFGRLFLRDLWWVSIFWALLNLLPVLPLDGGQMLNAVLGPQRIKITLWITIVFAVAVGVAMFIRTHSILFPVFLGMFAWQAWQALRQLNGR